MRWRRRTDGWRSFTLWIGVVLAAGLLLQLIPVFGLLVAILLVGTLSILLPLFFVSFIVECVAGPIPRGLVVVPVAVLVGFGIWYAGLYNAEHEPLRIIAARLAAQNAGLPAKFDASKYSLVVGAEDNDLEILTNYDLPAVFRDYGGRHAAEYPRSSLTLSRSCNLRPYTGRPWVPIYVAMSIDGSRYCVERTSEPPTLPAVKVGQLSRPYPELAKLTFGKSQVHFETYQATLSDGTILATYTRAEAYALSPIPTMSLCLVPGAGAMGCYFGLRRETTLLSTVPTDVANRRRPTYILLDLPERSIEDLARLKIH